MAADASMCRTSNPHAASGFTLIEVLIAMALLVSVAVGVAHMIGIGTNAGRAAREQTSATILAGAKLEQLRSLAWAYDPDVTPNPIPRSDLSANVSVDPPGDGGPGLSSSPPGTLAANMPPYVDYLDVQGRWVGNGSSPPAQAAFIRRWSVRPLPEAPSRTLILSVLVTTVAYDRARTTAWTTRTGPEALLIAFNTRKGK
jgi:prepilin-type N-terminal cleavage/methylation domain-containing protein